MELLCMKFTDSFEGKKKKQKTKKHKVTFPYQEVYGHKGKGRIRFNCLHRKVNMWDPLATMNEGNSFWL